jgi:pimeloyl-ACP methyl ester carboxylesterase
MHVVFVAGSGRSGAAAWPGQAAAVDLGRWSCTFVDLTGLVGPDEQRDAVLGALGDGGHLVAHSVGAVPALLAAGRSPGAVGSLALLEPAAFSATRGGPRVEAHVAAMSAVFAQAADPRMRDGQFAVRFLTALGAPGAAIADPGDPSLRSLGRRLRRSTPPWEVPLDRAVASRVPTLVVTGGWSPLYEEVGESLAAAGARHTVLAGYGHRVQDHPEANAVLAEHWRAAEA